MSPNFRCIILLVLACVEATIEAAPATDRKPQIPSPKPVPRMQATPLPDFQMALERDGTEIARMHFNPAGNRPFVFPLIGPSGRPVTRIGHPHDPSGHSHHNSVWISHEDVNGISFWNDKGDGRIIHKKVDWIEDSNEDTSVMTISDWTTRAGDVLLQERRVTTARALTGKEWILIIDLRLEARTNEVTIGKSAFGLLGVRMAKTIGVKDGGGTVTSSEGGINEKGTFWKPARWIDYSGPITTGVIEGVTLMDHPANSNHPSVFHIRDDGWMGSSFTFDGPRVLKKGEAIQLRYGLFVHSGGGKAKSIEPLYRLFASSPLPDLTVVKK